MDLASSSFSKNCFGRRQSKKGGSKIDKNLADRLSTLLKEGSLDKEPEILRILETLTEKLNSLEKKGCNSTNPESEDERRKSRIHQKWGKDPFSQEI